eukprot:TRINITY_DN2954_c0_g1_i3.p1 TRINITY_DN2954_c0_g1~~TRINITY_DN2954_c0_g1_i3.p1  ORF type:complete len:267 (-),score=42.27 TRINITY_DN2954_c0_g1_i3:201-1001(-)
MIRRPPRSTLSSSSAASDVYKRQVSTQSTGACEFTEMLSDLPDVITFNVVVVGDSGVGKSSLIKQYCSGAFEKNQTATVGFDLQTADVQRDGKTLSVKFYDTAGDPKFQTLAKMYYSNQDTQAFVLVYDITNYDSFSHLEKWLSDVTAELPASRRAQFLVLGNKIDQRNKVAVQMNVAKDWADAHGFTFREASARTGQDVNAAMNSIVDAVYEAKYRPRVLVERISKEEFQSGRSKSHVSSRATEDETDTDDLPDGDEVKGCCLIA